MGAIFMTGIIPVVILLIWIPVALVWFGAKRIILDREVKALSKRKEQEEMDAPCFIKHLVNADIGIELVHEENRLLAPRAFEVALARALEEKPAGFTHVTDAPVEYFTCDGFTIYCQPPWVELAPLCVDEAMGDSR